jgi:dephospho-CoA kinase
MCPPPRPSTTTQRARTPHGSDRERGIEDAAALMVPRCLGLTGGIGAGKSTALAGFAACGAATLSSDDVVHDLYAQDDVRDLVRERFGAEVFHADGSVDRQALAARAFADPAGIRFLEGVLYPRIQVARDAWVRARRAEGHWRLLVVEVPLLFEAGLVGTFDAVLVVSAAESTRRERIGSRGQNFAERADRQWTEERKLAAADRAFLNDGDPRLLDEWVHAVFTEFATPVIA